MPFYGPRFGFDRRLQVSKTCRVRTNSLIIQIIGKHAVLKETLEATDRKNYYLISSDVLELNYTIMNHRQFLDWDMV